MSAYAPHACYTFNCKIIRNVYMSHHYPSAVRHCRIVGALLCLRSFATPITTFSARVLFSSFAFIVRPQHADVLLVRNVDGNPDKIRVIWYQCSQLYIRKCFVRMRIRLLENHSDTIFRWPAYPRHVRINVIPKTIAFDAYVMTQRKIEQWGSRKTCSLCCGRINDIASRLRKSLCGQYLIPEERIHYCVGNWF